MCGGQKFASDDDFPNVGTDLVLFFIYFFFFQIHSCKKLARLQSEAKQLSLSVLSPDRLVPKVDEAKKTKKTESHFHLTRQLGHGRSCEQQRKKNISTPSIPEEKAFLYLFIYLNRGTLLFDGSCEQKKKPA